MNYSYLITKNFKLSQYFELFNFQGYIIIIIKASKKIQKAWKDMKERKFRDEYRKLYEMSKPPSKSLHALILTKDNQSNNQYNHDDG
jgi:hypothetical protein